MEEKTEITSTYIWCDHPKGWFSVIKVNMFGFERRVKFFWCDVCKNPITGKEYDELNKD